MPLQKGAKELCLHSQCLRSRHELRAVHRIPCGWIQSHEASEEAHRKSLWLVRSEDHRSLIETLGDANLQSFSKDERMTRVVRMSPGRIMPLLIASVHAVRTSAVATVSDTPQF